ncbi:MAG TPA: ATP-binding protein, partial [Solirubrobacteraceae bacterium]|nr:ATP-binding protein [Solirubrobacteraceae bacterium]
MTADARDDAGADLALALLRATLVVVIVISEQLIDERRLDGPSFWLFLAVAVVYSIAGVFLAVRHPRSRALARIQPGLDVLLLAGLTYGSGGAFSDVRKAFFVIPLAAAFKERPRTTAMWSITAVVAFTVEAALAGGHVAGNPNSWQHMTFSQDLYLAWTGAAASILALALARRSAQTETLAASRQRLVTRAIEAVERERTRLAGALHDEPVQSLIAARHDLRRAERTGDPESFARLHEALKDTIGALREEIFNLHPHVLDHVGLGAAIEQIAQRMAIDGDVRVTVEVDADATRAHEQVLFSLARELLGNAARHARASEIRVRVRQAPDHVTLEVSDDGRGIPEGRVQQALLEGHIGLAEISERVAALGGRVATETEPGAGTRHVV